jgi:hypothetical protein
MKSIAATVPTAHTASEARPPRVPGLPAFITVATASRVTAPEAAPPRSVTMALASRIGQRRGPGGWPGRPDPVRSLSRSFHRTKLASR